MTSEIYEKTGKQEKPCQACIWFERYEILEILGEGGTGRVYLARDIRLGRLVAIKILEKVTEQFQEEVTVLRQQSFGMLPVIYDAWKEDEVTGVIVMEYVEGQNLKEYLALHKQIPEQQIYDWGMQLGKFLSALHGRNPKVLYRDLKPENIMVQPDNTLRLVDVGAAVRLEAEEVKNKRVGTYGYAAPEQWEGKDADERADIYGLGAVLYAVAAGEEALKSRVASEYIAVRAKVSAGMMRVIGRCLREEKNRRYATADAFLTDWRRCRNMGKAGLFIEQLQTVLRYFFLYAAVYVIWYRNEFLELAWRFLAGYLLLKAVGLAYQKYNEKWEQKKSVWCRSCEYGTISE